MTSLKLGLFVFILLAIIIVNRAEKNAAINSDIDQISKIMNLGIASNLLQKQQQLQQHQLQKNQQTREHAPIVTQHLPGIEKNSGNENSEGHNNNMIHTNEKRSTWQNLQGSWGKRTENNAGSGDGNVNEDYDDSEFNYYFPLVSGLGDDYSENDNDNGNDDDNGDNDENNGYENDVTSGPSSSEINDAIAAAKFAYLLHGVGGGGVINPIFFKNEDKRGWKSMSGAWGKRFNNGGNRYRGRGKGSWGKREPGWNNLKGLWGKRATNWSKLQGAWGKRSIESAY